MALEEGTEELVWTPSDYAIKSGMGVSSAERIIKHVRAKDVCVQAGGHRGLWPKYLAEHFKHVYTFEPHDRNFRFLQVIATAENITAYHAALGDSARMVTLGSGNPARITTGGYRVFNRPGPVPMMRVDDLPLTALDALCLDIEGAELMALKGAEQSISKYKPLIVVENNEGCCENFGYEFKDLDEWILAHDYLPGQWLIGRDFYYVPRSL